MISLRSFNVVVRLFTHTWDQELNNVHLEASPRYVAFDLTLAPRIGLLPGLASRLGKTTRTGKQTRVSSRIHLVTRYASHLHTSVGRKIRYEVDLSAEQAKCVGSMRMTME